MATWKQLEDYKRYDISSTGQVRNRKTGTLMARNLNSTGYPRVSLYNESSRKYKQCLLHRLVAHTYLPTVEGKDTVNHIDGDKTNPNVMNLEWCTRSENNVHAYKTGLRPKKLSDTDKAAIMKALEVKTRQTGAELAKKYGVSKDMIRKMWNGNYIHKL